MRSRSSIDPPVTSRPFSPPAPEPTTLGELLARAVAIYRSRPGLFVLIMFTTALPVGLLGILAGVSIDENSDRARQAIGALAQIVPVVLIYPISAVATLLAVVAIVNGRAPSAGGSLRPVLRRLATMGAVLIVTTIAILAGLVAFILPGIFLLVIWFFAAQSAVLEGLGVRASLSRSVELVRGGWASVLGTFVVLEIITAAIITLVLLAVRALADAAVVVAGLTAIVLTCLVKPFEMIGLALLYLDRRVRHEGRWPDVPDHLRV
jgi:hypothetical protein